MGVPGFLVKITGVTARILEWGPAPRDSLVVLRALEGFQQCNWVLGGPWGVHSVFD